MLVFQSISPERTTFFSQCLKLSPREKNFLHWDWRVKCKQKGLQQSVEVFANSFRRTHPPLHPICSFRFSEDETFTSQIGFFPLETYRARLITINENGFLCSNCSFIFTFLLPAWPCWDSDHHQPPEEHSTTAITPSPRGNTAVAAPSWVLRGNADVHRLPRDLPISVPLAFVGITCRAQRHRNETAV